MFRAVLNVVLLVASAALVVGGLATYPYTPGEALAAMVATAALLLAPVGRLGEAE